MVSRTAVFTAVVAAACAAASPAQAQRRVGSVIGPLSWHLAANSGLCLAVNDARAGASVRLNPCGPPGNTETTLIYDNEFSYIQPLANPSLCVMVENGQAGATLVLNPCTMGRDANRSWSFTSRKGLWMRDNSDMCAKPEGGPGGRVLLDSCARNPHVWTCTVMPNPPAIDGAYPAERSQQWCDR